MLNVVLSGGIRAHPAGDAAGRGRIHPANLDRFPVFFDPERDAAAAFDAPGFPTCFVLDGAGRIRFAHHDIGRVIREVAALREQAQAR